MDWLGELFKLIGALIGLAPKVVDAAKQEEIGPPPPDADKDGLMKDMDKAFEEESSGK